MLLLFSTELVGQSTFDWVVNEGGQFNDEGRDIAVDQIGNVYVTGNVDPDSRFGSINLMDATAFLAKYTNQGNLIWVQGFRGRRVQSNAVTTDSLGNAYVGGAIWDSAFIQNDTLIPNGDHDFFICKFSSQGNLLWSKNGGTSIPSFEDYVVDLKVYRSKYLIATGMGANDTVGYHVSMYDVDGGLQWIKPGSSVFTVWPSGIDVDNLGNIYAGGDFLNSIEFEDSIYSGNGVSVRTPFIIKLDSTGHLQWLEKSDSSKFLELIDIAAVPDNNGCLSIGRRRTITPQASDIWVTRHDESGMLLWTQMIGGLGNERPASISYSPKTKEVYISGFSSKDTSAGMGYSTKAFIHCLDSNGATVWDYEVGSDADIPLGFENTINAMAISQDEVYFTGVMKGNMQLWPWTLTSNGNADVIIGKANLSQNFQSGEFIEGSSALEYYPNPTPGLVTIDFQKTVRGVLEVYSIQGSLLDSIQFYNTDKLRIDLTYLPQGMYLGVLKNSEGVYSFRIGKN